MYNGNAKFKNALLIDGDIVAFKAACAFQSEMFGLEDFDSDNAYNYMDSQIDIWCESFDARPIICLSDPTGDYFRKDIYPDYKANRKGSNKPIGLSDCKDHLQTHYKTYIKDKLEADDTLGILATHPDLIKADKKIIVSIDKDFEQIEGAWIFNPDVDKEPRYVTPERAKWFHMYQTLVGDPVDNYKGCKGIGDKKATIILNNWVDMWQGVVETFIDRGFTEEDALLQARLARILHHTDYNYEEKEVILWTPTQVNNAPNA